MFGSLELIRPLPCLPINLITFNLSTQINVRDKTTPFTGNPDYPNSLTDISMKTDFMNMPLLKRLTGCYLAQRVIFILFPHDAVTLTLPA